MIPSYRTTIILTRRSKGFRLGKRRLPKCCGIMTLYAVGQSLVMKLIAQKLPRVPPLPV